METRSEPTGERPGCRATSGRFYSRKRAFGRFGMRLFRPPLMEAAHWHGHIELNLCRGADMLYDFNGQAGAGAGGDDCACFWAGVPHQLVAVDAAGPAEPAAEQHLPADRQPSC